jgi:hypothetical protein
MGRAEIAVRLDDDDPLWESFSGGDGHWVHPEWSSSDGSLAAAFYAAANEQARQMLDLLIDRPGELVDADWLADQLLGSEAGPDHRRQKVSRRIQGMLAAHKASGRRYPFKWREYRNGQPTDYAMKPSVAALFREARRASRDGSGKPGYWWVGEPGENVFMEITRRDDIGADLKAPLAARGGGVTASYALVPLTRPGDVVVHYDSRAEAIVGVSVVTSPSEPAPIYWVARGTYARRAGEQARWLPGIRVPLSNYRELDAPVTLAEIRASKDALLELRQQIQARAGGRAIYFPWIPYRDTLRTFQSYLAKMPRAAIGMFPQLQAAVEQADRLSSVPGGFSPVEQAEDAVYQAAGKTARRGRGLGFQLDQAAKVAVEVHAMNDAAKFYGDSWNVEDVHGRESYDLVCRRGDQELRVEVKGTTTDGAEVILTPNEVEHARSFEHTALFILSNIKLERADDGAVLATGGVRHVLDPWSIDNGTLKPIGFRYQPAQDAR